MDASILEFSGAAHSAAEHNILFMVPEATANNAMNLMYHGENTIGTISATAGFGIGSLILPFDLSTDAVTPGRALGDESAFLVTSGDPQSPLPMLLGGGAMVSAGAAIVGSSSSPDKYKVIIYKNDQPNSYVERNAANVYHAMHGQTNKTYTYPAVIAESPAGYDVAAKVFGGGSIDKVLETLDIWESILEDHV